MTDCEDCRDQLLDVALQPVDQPLPESIAAHLANCADCRAELAQLREAWCLLPAAAQLPDAARTERIETALGKKIQSLPASIELRQQREPMPHRFGSRANLLRYAVAVTVLLALIAAQYGSLLLTDDSQGQVTAADRRQLDELTRRFAQRRELEEALRSPHVRYVSMLVAPQSPTPRQEQAYLVIDVDAREILLLASDLPRPTAGSYCLWLLSATEEVVGTKTLEMDGEGKGTAAVELPAGPVAIEKAVVTLEATRSPTRPSSHVVLQVDLRHLW